MTQIIRNTRKLLYHTNLRELIKPIRDEFSSYNWLLTNHDYILFDYKTKGLVDKLNYNTDRIEFSGQELLEIIDTREIQFIWGVFCGVSNQIPTIGKKDLPFADCNPKVWAEPETFFLEESNIEIICFDGTATIIRFRDENKEKKFLTYFDEAEKLEKIHSQLE